MMIKRLTTYYMHRHTDLTLTHTISSVKNKMSKIALELPQFALKGISVGTG